ncbi:MAG: phosphatase PAP2 family protein [Firmicutes bacterium]|nr:phosphatase PAP2 family protein [Bacillota bacterium]
MNEIMILNFIQEHFRTALGDQVMVFITHLGDKGLVWLALAIVLLFFPKWRKAGFTLLFALLFELLIANVTLKPLVARIRPFELNPGVDLLIPPPEDFSFPSGHTGASFAAIFALGFRRCKLWIPALLLGCLIAYSRMYIYVHFPSDILGGVLSGLVSALLGWAVTNQIQKRRNPVL